MKLKNKTTQIALWACSVSAMAALTGPATAEEPFLELHSVGLYDWPSNDKDQRAMEAFLLLRDRLDDLAVEFDMDPEQAQMMKMGWDLLTARSALRFAPNENGIDASFVLAPENGNTEAMHQQLGMLAMMGGMEFEDQGNGIAQAMGPMGPMNLGFDEDRIWLLLGESEPASLDVSGKGLPKGTEALMSGRVDVNSMVQMFAPDMYDELVNEEFFEASGLGMFIGPDASVVEFAVGVDDASMHMVSRMIGASKTMTAMGSGPDMAFSKRDLRAFPVDSVQMSAFPTNISGTLEAMQAAFEIAGENPFEMVEEEIGIDLWNDVLANIGDRGMYYQSESTGGGGLTSMVILLELRDAAGMAKAHAQLVDRLNELAADEIDGYARVHTWDNNGVPSFSMTAPGLPIPIEPSWAISKGKLVFTLSPLALTEAIAQLNGKRDSSILDNEGFKSAVLSRMGTDGAVSVYYADAPRLAAKGYGMTNLLTSALANAARSPEHPDRVEGSLMPGYHAFMKDVAPMGGVGYWDGDDYVSHYFGDRSVLVQMATGLGTVADLQGFLIPAVTAGTLLPALGQARERANSLRSSTQLRSMAQAIVIFGAENNDQPPSSVDDLVDAGIIPEELLVSPMGSSWDGGPDYTFRFTKEATSSYDAQYIVGIDRAALVNGEWEVYVVFADVHVELLSLSELDELLELEINAGAKEDLQIEDY